MGSTKDFLETAVGEIYNGTITITNLDIIKDRWQTALHYQGRPVVLENFTIIKGVAEGDAPQDYYLLLATTKDKRLKTASLLTLKGSKFYFEKQEGAVGEVSLNILCSGECGEGCDPVVKINTGLKYLNCSHCLDCTKSEKGIY